jgi:hypothetical protein
VDAYVTSGACTLVQEHNGISKEDISADDADLTTIKDSFRSKQIDWEGLAVLVEKRAAPESPAATDGTDANIDGSSANGDAGLSALMPECNETITQEMLDELVADLRDHPSQFFVMMRRPDFGHKEQYLEALIFAARFIQIALPGPMHMMKAINKRIQRTIKRMAWDKTVGEHGQVLHPFFEALILVRALNLLPSCHCGSQGSNHGAISMLHTLLCWLCANCFLPAAYIAYLYYCTILASHLTPFLSSLCSTFVVFSVVLQMLHDIWVHGR